MSRPSILLAPILVAAALCLLLLWWWPNRPQAGELAMPASRFNAVSFAPYRAGQSPFTESFPTAAEVDQDLALLARRTRAVRTYAAFEGDYDTAALAQRHGLKLWQGIWLGGNRAQNAREMARGIALANRYPETIERVVVGNEVLLRRDLPPAELIADIDQVRRSVHQPVTYADVWEFWLLFPEVARHVDAVTIHILPYWEDTPTGIDGAIDHVRAVYRRVVAAFPGKPVAIGETGWPSRGRWRRDAAPGLVNEVVFLRRFVAMAAAEHFDYNLIEAFDQVWKYRSEGVVGANWGLWTADRAAKFPLSGPVQEDAAWPVPAALSIGLGLLLLVGALAAVPGPDGRAQAWLALLAMALGGALGLAWGGATPVLYDVFVRLVAIGNLAGQAVLAWLLMLRAAALLGGGAVAPARTGAEASETVRDLLRLRPGGKWDRDRAFDDLGFVLVWTAGVLQLLLVFDPRYRDFPLSSFAVPLLAVGVRVLLRDLPLSGGGREELWAGGVLVVGALASAIREGALNHQSLAWNAAALVLAAPCLLRCRRRARVRAQA